MDLPPHLLDIELQRAAALCRAAQEDLKQGGPDAAPIVSPLETNRRVSSRSTYIELAEQTGDPIAAGLRAWVFALTLERVLWPDLRRLASAWHEATVEVEGLDRVALSPRALLARALRESTRERRTAWFSALTHGTSKVADAARILAARRAEAARLLGGDTEDSIELPVTPPTTSAAVISSVAAGWLEATADMADLREDDPWGETIARSMARGATAGWPAKLNARWVEDLFRSTRLTEGLSIDLGRLPDPLGAISFARTLSRFGRAFAEASAPPSAPFSLARPPFDLRAARRAALFGGLLADPQFQERSLGLGRDRAKAQAREIALATLLWLRLEAARVLLRGSLLLTEKQRKERFEEETARALGAPIPGSLAGVLPALSPDDASRFLGALLSATDRRTLVARFDEDWFRNPHAAEAIREEQATLPTNPRATIDEIKDGSRELTRAFETWLS